MTLKFLIFFKFSTCVPPVLIPTGISAITFGDVLYADRIKREEDEKRGKERRKEAEEKKRREEEEKKKMEQTESQKTAEKKGDVSPEKMDTAKSEDISKTAQKTEIGGSNTESVKGLDQTADEKTPKALITPCAPPTVVSMPMLLSNSTNNLSKETTKASDASAKIQSPAVPKAVVAPAGPGPGKSIQASILRSQFRFQRSLSLAVHFYFLRVLSWVFYKTRLPFTVRKLKNEKVVLR